MQSSEPAWKTAERLVYTPHSALSGGRVEWTDGIVAIAGTDVERTLDLWSFGLGDGFPDLETVRAAAGEWIEGGVHLWSDGDGDLCIPAPTLTVRIMAEAVRRWYTGRFGGEPIEVVVEADLGLPSDADERRFELEAIDRIDERLLGTGRR